MSEMESIQKDVDLIRDDVKEIKDALLGNEFNNGNGYVKRLSAVEQDVKEIKEGLLRNKWLLIGLSAGSGVGGVTVIKEIISALIN